MVVVVDSDADPDAAFVVVGMDLAEHEHRDHHKEDEDKKRSHHRDSAAPPARVT